jgi:hypothetical protein
MEIQTNNPEIQTKNEWKFLLEIFVWFPGFVQKILILFFVRISVIFVGISVVLVWISLRFSKFLRFPVDNSNKKFFFWSDFRDFILNFQFSHFTTSSK